MKTNLKSINKTYAIVGFLLTIAAVLFISQFYPLTKAQTTSPGGRGLQISPPSQEVSINPGETKDIKAKVTNTGETDANVKVSVTDITQANEEGQVSFVEKTNDLANWTKLDDTSFTLKKGESKEVKATITVPNSAAGGHYGSIVFSLEGAPTSEGPGVSQQVGSLFLVSVAGTTVEKMAIDQFSAPQFSEYGPIKFTLNFKNDGNVHIKPQGLITITDIFGRKVKDVAILGQNVFPGKNRIIETTLDNTWLFGPYKASAIIYYGANNESLTQTTSFYVLPYRIVGAVLLVLVALFLLRKRLVKAVAALGGK